MSMNPFESSLLTAAAQEMWFDPHDDRHFTLAPRRFNRLRGHRVRVSLGSVSYYMPDNDHLYTLYGFGQTAAATLGIENRRLELMRWTRLDTLALRNEMVINVHVKQRQLPLDTVYIQRNAQDHMLLAVQSEPNAALLVEGESLYLRVFSNDWLATEGQGLGNPIEYVNARTSDSAAVSRLLTRWRQVEDGNRLLHHNGYYVNDVTAGELGTSDTLSLSIDKSGLGYIDLSINDLHHYYSTRDGKNKLLVMLDLGDPMQAVPADELDIYICGHQPNVGNYPRVKGFFYSRVFESDLRQLTHQDFSLDAQRIEALIWEHREHLNLTSPFLRIFFRATTEPHKGQPQVDGNYTLDLYRCPADIRRSLMVETASTFSPWQADELEYSPYVLWQNGESHTLSISAIKGVYSLEELTRRVLEGWKPEVLLDYVPGHTGVVVPFLGTIPFTMLGYDAQGYLVEVKTEVGGQAGRVLLMDGSVTQVRFIPGDGRTDPRQWDRDTDFVAQSDWFADTLYWRSVESEDWIPAKPGIDFDIAQTTGGIRWREAHQSHERMRRTVRDSIVIDREIDTELLHHPIDLYNGNYPPTLLRLSHLEVYLEGWKLVEGVDYLVNYPNIQLCSKMSYLESLSGWARLVVLHYGAPNDEHYWRDYGFVRNRRMVDGDLERFTDLRAVMHTVDGAWRPVDDLDLLERPAQVMASDIREGALYCRESPVQILSAWARMRLVRDDGMTLGDTAGRVLGPFLERPRPSPVVFIDHAHALFSPFVYRMVQRLRSKEIDVEQVGYTRGAVTFVMQRYLDELQADILSQDLDWDLVDVHPAPANHQMEITENDMQFLRTLNELYLHNRLVFTTYFSVIGTP